MEIEFWDGFDLGYDLGFMDGAELAITRLTTIHNKKMRIAIITSSLFGAVIAVGVKKLFKRTRKLN